MRLSGLCGFITVPRDSATAPAPFVRRGALRPAAHSARHSTASCARARGPGGLAGPMFLSQLGKGQASCRKPLTLSVPRPFPERGEGRA